MKLVLSIILSLSATSAMATNFVCEKQVTAERVEGAVVSTGRYNMNISLTSRECASSYCSATHSIPIMDNSIMLAENCTSSEGTMSLDITCASGKDLNFSVDELGTGRIYVSLDGQFELIELGQCTIQ